MKSKLSLPYILAFCLLAAPGFTLADEVKIDVSGANALHSTLTSVVGKSVTLKLNSNQEISGKVVSVGPNAVHISELKGQEFFDAVVRLDDVSAVVLRVK